MVCNQNMARCCIQTAHLIIVCLELLLCRTVLQQQVESGKSEAGNVRNCWCIGK